MLIPAFILTLYIASTVSHNTDSKRILDPHVGDLYEISIDEKSIEDYKYTLYKVAEIKGDSIKVLLNEYEYRDPRKLRRREALDAFYGSRLYFTKGQLKKMFDDDIIMDIKRD